ncbi:MAG: hypothetical protein Q9222_005280 [Ikaeria aurantiellina]
MQSSATYPSRNIVSLCASIKAIIEQYAQSHHGELDVEAFRLEVQTLHSCLTRFDGIRHADTLEIEESHLSNVNRLLHRCHRTLGNLHKTLDQHKALEPRPNDVGQSWNLGGSEIYLPRAHISFHTRTLQMSSRTMTLISRWKSHYPTTASDSNRLSKDINALRNSVLQRRKFTGEGEHEDCVEERGLLRDVDECLKTAEDIARLTTSGDVDDDDSSFRSLVNAQKYQYTNVASPRIPQPESMTDEQASDDSEGESIAESEPDIGGFFSQEAYEKIISHLRRELEKEMSTKNFDQAEKTYKTMEKRLIDREAILNMPFENRSQMKEKLAEIYLHQKRYRKAKGTISSILQQDTVNADRKWRLYLFLGCAYRGLLNWSKAEHFSQKSLTGRTELFGRDNPLTRQSAEVVIDILEQQNDMKTAIALRELYCPQTIPPPPPKSALRNHSRRTPSPPRSPPVLPQISQPAPIEEEKQHPSKPRVRWDPNVWGSDTGINAPVKSGRTLLIDAIYDGDEEHVIRILERGASVEARCVDCMSPLMHAVITGHEGIVGTLLRWKADQDALTSGWTPLHMATDNGNLGIMKLLLKHDADIDSKAPFTYTPPVTPNARARAKANNEPDPISDPVPEEERTWTPLLRAASKGDEPAVRLLLDYGANIEARSPSQATPLMLACEALHFDVVDLLLMRNANVHAADKNGWQPLHRALSNRSPLPNNIPKLLLDREADVNARCDYSKTPLHYAVEHKDLPMANFLLANGADIEAQDCVERTPLHTAIEARSIDMVILLIQLHADATAREASGYDALGVAYHVQNKSPEIIEFLKRHKKEMKRSPSSTTGGADGKGRSRSGSWFGRGRLR